MRDYKLIDSYLNELAKDIYAQPEDEGHTNLAGKVVNHWMTRLTTCKSVLDLGCGTGFCQPMFEKHGVSYEGICLGEDYLEATRQGRNVRKMDYHFLDYEDGSFDLLFSRHSWEHSAMPLLALMEWRRVSKQWLGLVVPSPEYWGVIGRNHYNVLYQEQIINLLSVAGWKVLWNEVEMAEEDGVATETPLEYWLFCEKRK